MWYFLTQLQRSVWMDLQLLMKYPRMVIQIKFIFIFKAVDGVKEQIHKKHFKIATKEVKLKKGVHAFIHNQI
jgi:uncharacterized protein Usg